MKQAIILYNPKGAETVDRLVAVARDNFDLELIKRKDLNNSFPKVPVIRYGTDDGFNLDKDEQCELFSDIIGNTLCMEEPEDYETVVVKNPTRIMLGKDWKAEDTDESCYHYINNKSEWRVNYSFGKVNSVYNKNLLPTTIFGKADVTQWTYERDKDVRKYLIGVVKQIAELLKTEYPKLEHFGIDIIRDNTDGTYYFLELNKAHSLNEENCGFFLKGWLETLNGNINKPIPTPNSKTNIPSNNNLTDEELVFARRIMKKLFGE